MSNARDRVFITRLSMMTFVITFYIEKRISEAIQILKNGKLAEGDAENDGEWVIALLIFFYIPVLQSEKKPCGAGQNNKWEISGGAKALYFSWYMITCSQQQKLFFSQGLLSMLNWKEYNFQLVSPQFLCV